MKEFKGKNLNDIPFDAIRVGMKVIVCWLKPSEGEIVFKDSTDRVDFYVIKNDSEFSWNFFHKDTKVWSADFYYLDSRYL